MQLIKQSNRNYRHNVGAWEDEKNLFYSFLHLLCVRSLHNVIFEDANTLKNDNFYDLV